MLKLYKSMQSKMWYIKCPYCLSCFNFSIESPVFCTKCYEELPNYYKLIDEVSERTNYHKLHESWRLDV